ncbi:uncharacterized protein LOC110193241 [Phascolarctos cinereus]
MAGRGGRKGALTSLPVPLCCHSGNLASWTCFVSLPASLSWTRELVLLRPSGLPPTQRRSRPVSAPAAAGEPSCPRGSRVCAEWSWLSGPVSGVFVSAGPGDSLGRCLVGPFPGLAAPRRPLSLSRCSASAGKENWAQPRVLLRLSTRLPRRGQARRGPPRRVWGWSRKCSSCARSLNPRGLGGS